MRLRTLSLSISLAALVACNLGPSKTDDSAPADDSGAPSGGGVAAIQAGIIDGSVADGDEVRLEGVIATSAFDGSGEGFFVQDPGGGEWSGIYVFVQAGGESLFLEVGDELTVSGRVTEFYDWTELTINSANAVEVTGSGEVVSTPVDPCAVDDWEPYESVLVSLGASEAVAGPNTYGEVELSCGLVMDDLLSPFEGELGATWTDITGLIGYSYSTWRLFPRGDADLSGYVPGAGPEEVSCADIRTGGFPDYTRVQLVGAVVTSEIVPGEGFFVQDPGGGEWSGLFVFTEDRAPDLVVSPGDVVDVEGSVVEFYGWTELSIDDAGDVTVTGQGDVSVDALDACAVDDWEPWESTLVELGAREATDDPSRYGEVPLDCGPMIDDLFIDTRALAEGDTYTQVRGLISYGFEAFRINPRDEGDIEGRVPGEGGGGGDPVTIPAIQQGEVSDGDDVRVEGAVVTSALNAFGNGFYAADPAGGAWSGIYVYLGGSYSGPLPSVGDLITIEGEVVEYYDLTEITRPTITVTGQGAVPAPVELTAPPADWEPYEGVEVRLIDLGVTSAADSYGEHATDWGGLMVSDLFGPAPVAEGQTYSAVTGFITYNLSAWKIDVDELADVVP